MEIGYWIIVVIIIYAYLGYPIVLYMLSILFNYKKINSGNAINKWPGVDLLIAAYNEEKVIHSKIENSINLDYPSDKFNIWIASDGSSDRTNEIVRKYEATNKNVHLLEFKRTGKSGVINRSMNILNAEIVVFSDANTEYSKDVIKKLIRHFQDPNIGCVSGRLKYRNPGKTMSGIGESVYWRYETALKKLESKIGFVAGANGAVYAIRKNLFEPLHKNTINDDFTESMTIVKKGYMSIYEEKAMVFEDVAPSMQSEFKRHIRDGAGHYIAIIHLLGLLNPFLGMKSFIYYSHRIFRWMVPFLLIFIFIINILLLNNFIYQALFIFQCIFYMSAIIGWIGNNYKKIPFIIYIPFYFCNLNLALFLGFIKAVTNKQKPTWERTERNSLL
jgi:cellulose synthase/poly-beta-1,6-N-acetylglucosamine synthase-like glycosyltransferase|tara:strand:+ start:502 stop:1665 length:1164 start_codon:yes stop_codon:yes gene_type:complete